MRIKPKKSGATLLTTLAFLSLGLVLMLVLSSASLSQLHRSTSQGHALRAQRAAESVLALATERIFTQSDFATTGSKSLSWESDGSAGRLSFDTAKATSWKIPVSVNNQEGATAVDGWNDVALPPKSVQLVAVGESGGVKKTIDAVIMTPDFPYALASSGPIESKGGLVVGALGEEGLSELEFESLLPADLYSSEAGKAVSLEGKARIKGDVKAIGSISLGPDVQVAGVAEQGTEPLDISPIDIKKLRPGTSDPLQRQPGRTKLKGSYHYNKPTLHLNQGLELDEGLLYVNGDLKISGGLSGKGASL